MLLAILSDTHDNVLTTQAALALLAPRRPDLYLHAGDLVAPHMLDLFQNLPLHFIFGNNEFDLAALRSRALALNFTCHERRAEFTLANRRIAMLHGDDHSAFNQLLHSGNYHYLIHGHTHVRRDETITNAAGQTTRIINPGALHRAKNKSVALLNLATDHLEFLSVRT